ncbi:MAG: adenylate/guanylate cyclase domain-containing protein [Acidobacteria bacterium]|nr:adenylate/guanylate cyclase domain-containing protein [Acidobacteriota bacterium]
MSFRRPVAGVVVGLAAASLVIALTGLEAFRVFELKTYDWRLASTAVPSAARTDIALIEIDEYSLRNLQPHAGRWPWPRVVHSSLIDYLMRGAPALIVYDVNFAEADTRVGFQYGGSSWSGVESDKALADSMRKAGNVILPMDATFEGDQVGSETWPDQGYRLSAQGITERRVIFPPTAELASSAAALGHNLFILDSDGPLRHTVPFVRTGDRAVPSLGLAAALRAAKIQGSDLRLDDDMLAIGDRRMPLEWRRVNNADGEISYLWELINFRGPPLLPDLKTRPYPAYSFFDLLYSEEQLAASVTPNVDPSIFKDKIVFVGMGASGLFDAFETPFAGGRMPGIQVHAAVTDDFLSNRFMQPESRPTRIALVLGMALAVGLVAVFVPAWWAALIFAGLVAGYALLATRLFAQGQWINLTQPTLASSLALFGGVAYQYFVEGREKRKMKRLFGQYVSKDVFDQLVAHPELARLGGQRREMTVLFSDIRGFTTVSERGEAEEIVRMLNEYFTRMVDIVFAHKGTLDKFVGDMVMALFGAPLDDPDHAQHAVDAAKAMIRELNRLNDQWAAEGRPRLDIGIGISTGPMIAGNIGSEAIMSYTVIGDAVNLGARLESLNKEYGTRIIISEATRNALSDRDAHRPLGDVVVKGKTRPVAIYEVKEHHA